MVITALTRNQVYRQRYRGFESHPLRHERNLFCLPRQERFLSCLQGQNTPKSRKISSKQRVERSSRPNHPLCLLFRGEKCVLLFAFLYRAKKLAKQHPTGFEYRKPQRYRGKVTPKPCKSTGFVLYCLMIIYTFLKECPWRRHIAQENWQKYILLKPLEFLRQ